MNWSRLCVACCPQESEVVYCGRLSLVADLLQGLFKEAYSLQKALLELLDRISLESSASKEEVSDIVTGVCLYIYSTCVCEYESLCVSRPNSANQLFHYFTCISLTSFNIFFMCLSDSQHAGYLLCYLQPGHSTSCKHMEIPHQVSRADAHVYAY